MSYRCETNAILPRVRLLIVTGNVPVRFEFHAKPICQALDESEVTRDLIRPAPDPISAILRAT
jgi:hypothetical protein